MNKRGKMIKLSNVNKNYLLGDEIIPVLKDISMDIHKGQFVSIMGPSGSGKSSLLYLMSGLDFASQGSIKLNNKEISGLDDKQLSDIRRKKLGFVFQSYNLIDNLTVEENILAPALLDGKKRKEMKSKVDFILEAVNLQDRRNHTPRELSGGQQQRTAIGRALINDPDIIFADEPTGNLDSKTGMSVLKLLKNVSQKRNITIVMVTHDINCCNYCDSIINLKDGRIN